MVTDAQQRGCPYKTASLPFRKIAVLFTLAQQPFEYYSVHMEWYGLQFF